MWMIKNEKMTKTLTRNYFPIIIIWYAVIRAVISADVDTQILVSYITVG